jgi:hypothetical protein
VAQVFRSAARYWKWTYVLLVVEMIQEERKLVKHLLLRQENYDHE